MQAIVHQCFRAIAASTTDTLSDVQVKTDISLVKEIRQLLPANDPNALYVFICCLSSVDPKLWAGISPEYPAVLEEWEVERVMKLLDCDDKIIRKQVRRARLCELVRSLTSSPLDTADVVDGRPKHSGRLLCTGSTGRPASLLDARN